MRRLVVIDGKSVFYRGYYAMGALSTSDGKPTGGVYGFAAIAMELVKKLRPDKVVVAWDKAGTSVAKRKRIFDGYKAGRVKPPEDFFEQMPRLRELIEALGWEFVERDEYEADDIIGTLAFQAVHSASSADALRRTSSSQRPKGLGSRRMSNTSPSATPASSHNTPSENPEYEVIIISSDLDMLQVVDENVKMYRLLKGFSELEEIDVKAVEAKYGIKKEQFLDLKALKGDASDNIPGVPGIGEKGAVKLLNEFGSLDGIYNNIEKVTGATRKKLEEGKESAYMSYDLAKIMTDAPVELDEMKDLVVDPEKILAELKKLEFSSLIRKYSKDWSAEQSSAKNEEKSEITEVKLPEDVIFSFDIKGLMHRDEKVAKKILAGAKFYDLGQGKFLLNPLARKNNEEQGTLFGDDLGEMTAEYARQQTEFAKYPKLKWVLEELDFPMIPVLYKIEQRGMKVDAGYFDRLRGEYEKYVERLTAELYNLAGVEFNLNSPIQLGEVLFEKLGLPTKGIKKTQRGYSTGAKELEKLKGLHPIVPKLMEYREAAKLLNTYIVPLPALADENGRIHTTFTQDVTATGRLSSVNPNLQNIPTRTEAGKKIREGFVADEGRVMISADYAQFELRLAAAMSGDEALVEDFNKGVDIHTKTAAEVYGIPMSEVTKEQRREAKVVNFGIIYGMSAKGLADATGMTIAEAKEFERQYFELRKPIELKLKSYLEQAKDAGYVETWYGRRRPTPDVKSANFVVRMGAERAAQNMPIQGTEADLMKRAMIMLDKKLPEGAEMIMQVHDSVMVECAPELADEAGRVMKEVMENVAPELGVKLSVDVKVGRNWGEV